MKKLSIILSLAYLVTGCVVQTPYSYSSEVSYRSTNNGYYRTYYYVPVYQGQYTIHWGTTNPTYNPKYPCNPGYRGSYYTNRYDYNQPLPTTNYPTPQRTPQVTPRSNQQILNITYTPRYPR